MTLVRYRGKWYAYSFTTGTKLAMPKIRMNDDTVQAECLWLVKQGKIEEADALLNRYCAAK